MSKRKIGINVSYLRKPNTGIGQVTLNFLRKLKDLEKEAEIILYAEEDFSLDGNLPKNFSKKVFLPFWERDDLIRKILWEKFSLPRRAKKDGCDVFFSLYQCPTIFGKSIHHIMLVHDIIPKIFPGYLDNIRKKLYWSFTEKGISKAGKIISVSKRTEKDLISKLGISGKKVTTSYVDCDEIFKRPVSEKRKSEVLDKFNLKSGYILAGGGYEVRKNIESVVRAYKILEGKNERGFFMEKLPELVIYGKILPKNLKLATDIEKLLKDLNLTKKVKLLGQVSEQDMPVIFSETRVFVYPSFYEGFGLPVLEAISLGRPVITSKISSLPEIGGDGVLYCDAKDISNIAMVIKNVLGKKDLREDLKNKAIIQAQKFSWEKFVENFLNIIEEI